MSTQAIGAAAAGTAILGGGGATIAYAAGAFDPKVKDQQQTRHNYRTLAESMVGKQYIGDKKTEIQTLWDNTTNNYKTTLKSAYWDNMVIEDVTDAQKPTKTDKGKFDDAAKKDEILTYVSVWCQAVAVKELNAIPENVTGGENKDHKRWEAFKFACFKAKTGQ
ncbi:hypothetical protein [Candidatus Mycoplasma haematohominis]|uniref:Uncharacterized protein n=1 Tax=Candidatus Mycoplasma haematohominis TaxID=1494318 RepID=A0A478FQA6_9MOLU|nr:hypothetical protein [Candidatus Mycoplasma haemohominis]GCE63718.1 hypothetical protein MHSWG343_07180 [Candidatus Mycoplasma haemohominis]